MARILIDLSPEVHKALRHKAIDVGKPLKPYIEEHLTTLANVKKSKTKVDPMDF